MSGRAAVALLALFIFWVAAPVAAGLAAGVPAGLAVLSGSSLTVALIVGWEA